MLIKFIPKVFVIPTETESVTCRVSSPNWAFEIRYDIADLFVKLLPEMDIILFEEDFEEDFDSKTKIPYGAFN